MAYGIELVIQEINNTEAPSSQTRKFDKWEMLRY